ncbi:cytochrome b [Silvimonas amylolytica]|nr:cytochrome b [Silvimonas amylolytica]
MQTNRYAPSLVLLHWLMFLLFAIALAAIEYRGFVPKTDPSRPFITMIHMTAGVLVLILACVRVAVRFTRPAPRPVPGPLWQIGAARLLYLLMYVVMFALPLAGIYFVQAGGRDVAFFGTTLPHFFAANPDLRGPVKDFHEFVGNAVYYIVGLHILAALFHQFVLKDGIMSRMRMR